ncbi:hypothetical protein HOD83_03260 [Candidatus Woesearchaeota archaeon]|jgi:hypothetical protein|nr:hypothetical protein [Candidatus Woesearchaeota archaeon]MBT4114358.1 hypothetical protein [Candidatus Woesearchaeota archaeon]MBT4248577.1 hypothetical protein [Candidatus Woesearchaeota archaeon]
MKVVKFTALAALFVAVFVASIGFNVLAHEGAHYAVADLGGNHPEMHFTQPDDNISGFLSAESNIAYVQYESEHSETVGTDAAIAVAGPLANLVIACLGLLFYFGANRSDVSKILLLVLITASFVSFGVNILPISPNDGFYVWQFLF